METCSNCGASNRPGAKFCTSCGIRLPTMPARNAEDWNRSEATPPAPTTPSEPEQADGAPSAQTDASWSSSPASPSVTADAADAADPIDEPRAPDAEPVATVPSWSWQPQPATPSTDDRAGDEERSIEGDGTNVPATGDDTEASTGGPEGDASTTLSSWASQWTGEYAAAPDSDERQATRDVPAAAVDPQTGEPAGEVAPGPDEEPATAAVSSEPPEQGHDEFGAAAVSESLAASQSGEPSATGTGIEPAKAGTDQADQEDQGAWAKGESDAVRRAEQLLDELRTLLPSLAASSTPSAVESDAPAASDAGAVADELESARRDRDDFSSLRSALESARDRPRDVDTMLGLVGRIDAMIAALDAHDRYAAAIDRATGQLRRPSEGPTQQGGIDEGLTSPDRTSQPEGVVTQHRRRLGRSGHV